MICKEKQRRGKLPLPTEWLIQLLIGCNSSSPSGLRIALHSMYVQGVNAWKREVYFKLGSFLRNKYSLFFGSDLIGRLDERYLPITEGLMLYALVVKKEEM